MRTQGFVLGVKQPPFGEEEGERKKTGTNQGEKKRRRKGKSGILSNLGLVVKSTFIVVNSRNVSNC